MKWRKFDVSFEKKKSWQKVLLGWLFSHIGLFFMSIGYAVLGSYIYILLELPFEEETRLIKLDRSQDINTSVIYLKNIFWIYANNDKYNFTRQQYEDAVSEDLTRLKLMVVDYYKNHNFDDTENWEYSWTFPKALLFTLTIMTTIGYGHIVPKTNPGKMFSIGYALVGIPLLLVFMANIGELMGSICQWIYGRICCGWCKFRRKKSEREIPMHQDDEEDYMNVKTVNVPIFISILLIVSFSLLGAFTFSSWEKWPLATSIYFCFITLGTIGFGDYVPLKSFIHYNEGTVPMMKMIFTVAYIILGIALVSMCIQLIQEEAKAKVARLATTLGMKKKKLSKTEKFKLKKEDEVPSKNKPVVLASNNVDYNNTDSVETNDIASNDMETNDMETNDMETNDIETNDIETNDMETNDIETIEIDIDESPK